MHYKYCSICGAKLKKQKEHLRCSRCPFINYQNPRPTVSALVLYKNKLLLTKRASPPLKNWWDLPGGFVEKNETPKQALKRELKEETGLNIKIKELFGIYPGTYPDAFDPCSILNIVYIAQSSTAKLKAGGDVKESKWFFQEKLPQKTAFDSNQKIIRDFSKIWS